MKIVNQLLNNQFENRILPFLWMHGEDENVIQSYVEKIYDSGIKAVCVEPRPHPDFVGERWWNDLGIVIEEARKREMKVWLFDDSHFPSGYANGVIERDYPHLRKKYLKINQVDYHGPQKNAGIIVKWMAGGDRNSVMSVGTGADELSNQLKNSTDKIIAVLAAKLVDFQTIDSNSMVDLTEKMIDGTVYWDLPEGNWRVFTLVETFDGGEAATEGYLNPIDSDATQILIDTVYEAHYNQFGDHFGKTIAGFFTDEPRFGNIKGPDASIGRMDMVLPWKDGLLDILGQRLEQNALKLLPLLICQGNDSNKIRYIYMDVVSQLYSENFVGKISKWCNEHGIEYIGHIIEDNNAHARLGYGAGHFFRGTEGQSMAGIDVVLHQLLPGLDQGYFKSFTSTGWDGEFFHYGLAKLGSSFSHLDPKKNNRAMVELFGAYGWSEGLRLMKWMADHMLVRGINHFVPHAFDMAPFPDADCPPHFYAHGNNPQYRYLPMLMNYMNRVSELLINGVHQAQSLILYHAEAEWSGEYMLLQKPAKILTQNQIDFDIISFDQLKNVVVKEQKIAVNKETFHTLIIPFAERLPVALIEHILRLAEEGISVIFVDALPKQGNLSEDITSYLEKLQKSNNIYILSLDNIVEFHRKHGFYDLLVDGEEKNLRYYHSLHHDCDVYMFFNESVHSTISKHITFKDSWKFAYVYNPIENTLKKIDVVNYFLELKEQESKLIVFTNKEYPVKQERARKEVSKKSINVPFKVDFSTSLEYPKFTDQMIIENLENITSPTCRQNFSGTIRYQFEIDVDQNVVGRQHVLDLGDVYEIAEVYVNGANCGVKISKPYNFDITEGLVVGKNKVIIEVTNTLGTQQKDFLSQYRALEPSGIVGKITLLEYVIV